jgi:site-specific recombinase XerC
LPTFATLLRAAQKARATVNRGYYARVTKALDHATKEKLDRLFTRVNEGGRTSWDLIKSEPKQPTAKEIKRFVAHLNWLREQAGELDPLAGVPVVKGARDQGRELVDPGAGRKTAQLAGSTTLKGKRDRALLALFVSAGLRREELAILLRDQMQQRDGRWCLVDLVGKGGRLRTVAIPYWTQQAVALWLEAMPIKKIQSAAALATTSFSPAVNQRLIRASG